MCRPMAEGKNCQNKTFNWRLPEQPTNALTSRARTERKASVQIVLLYTPHESDNCCFIFVVGKQRGKKVYILQFKIIAIYFGIY